MNMQAAEVLALRAPASATAGGVTGAYVDMQGFTLQRNIKAVWSVGAGTTAGTASGSIQTAEDTAGTGLATVATFTNVTAAGGTAETHFAPKANHRYARFIGDVQTGKDMIIGAFLVGEVRVRP
jgi:hypothetical protein